MEVVDNWDDYKRRRKEDGKKFRCLIHGYTKLGPDAVAALDTPQLQRLRHLQQLGCSSWVYPCAEHSRFAHSLGTGHLAAKAIGHLRTLQPDLELRPIDMTIAELAGLTHDVGHGPYSHVFEKVLVPALLTDGTEWKHEAMSASLIDRLVDAAHLDMSREAVRRVQDMVASGKAERKCCWTDREWMLEVVANEFNGVDVDKFDYLHRDSSATGVGTVFDFATPFRANSRVVDGHIGYKNGMEPTLHALFAARAEMHQKVYTHRKVKCVEYMVVDALLEANPVLRINERIHDPDEFLGLTDALLLEVRNSRDPALARAAAIARRIETRDIYPFCAEVEVPREEALAWRAMTAEEVAGHQDAACGVDLRPSDIRVDNTKIDFASGAGLHPARNVPIFKKDGSWHLCSELPFEPRLCMQRKVRVYLARDVPDPAARRAAVRAVQVAFDSAVRARLGSKAVESITYGGERQPAAPSKSCVSGRSGGGLAFGGGGRGRAAPEVQQPSGAGGADGRRAAPGGEVAGTAAGPGGGQGDTVTPEKLPPAKRRLGSQGPEEEGEGGEQEDGAAGAPRQRRLFGQPKPQQQGAAQQQEQQEQQQEEEERSGAVGSVEQDGGGGGADEDEEEEADMLLTQESASAHAVKRRRGA